MLPIILLLVVIVMAATMILRGYKAEPVLLLSGLVLMFSAMMFGWGDVIPKHSKTTGISLLDPFDTIRYYLSYRAAKLGLMIMALMGFASYMQKIGANDTVVNLFLKPLSGIKSPNLLIFASFVLANLLHLAIPSATGLGVLLMGTLFPILVGLGLSVQTAAGIIASSLCVAYSPTAIDAIVASKQIVVNTNPRETMDTVEYLYNNQLFPALITMLVIAVAHVFWQKHCDTKAGIVFSPKKADSETDKNLRPIIYALLPMLPIIMAVATSKVFVKGVKLDITTIVLISMFISMIIEFIRLKSLKEVFAGFSAFLQGMGTAFSTVVALLVSAGVFAQGIVSTGALTIIINSAQNAGLPPFAMAIFFAIITLLAAMVMGSGNAPFMAFVELIPKIAQTMGVDTAHMILPMQQAQHMGRAMSPVSGVVIAVSSGAQLSPFDVVKRVVVPVSIGFVTHIIIIGIIF